MLVTLFVALPSNALAQGATPESATVESSGCPEDLTREVSRRFGADVHEPSRYRLTIRCEPSAIALRVSAAHQATAGRKIDVIAIPPKSRARLIAIALGELTSPPEPEASVADPSEREPAVVVAADPAPPVVEARAVLVGNASPINGGPRERHSFAAVTTCTVLPREIVMVGLGSNARWRVLHFGADAEIGSSRMFGRASSGSVDVVSLSALLAGAVPVVTFDDGTIDVMAGVRIGVVRASGRVNAESADRYRSDDVTAPWVAPTLGVAIHAGERARVGLVATLAGGFIAGGVRARAADAAPVEFGGGFARLGVGIGF